MGVSLNLQVCISTPILGTRNRLVLADEDPSEYSSMENLILTKNHFKKSNVMLCTFHGSWMAFKQAIVKTYGDQDVASLYGELQQHTQHEVPNRIIPTCMFRYSR